VSHDVGTVMQRHDMRARLRIGAALGSAWGFTAALLVIVLGSVLLVAELHERGDVQQQAHIVASELQQDAAELRVGWDALMVGESTLDEMGEVHDELRDLHAAATELQELSDDVVALEIERDLLTLDSAMESLLAAFRAGQVGAAEEVQAERAVSALDAFDARVDTANDHYEAAAARAYQEGEVGLWAAMLIAGLAVGGLSWRHEQIRRASHRALETRLEERVAEVAEITEQHRRLEAMKYSIVSAVSHELRTPLTAIQMSLEMLEEGYAGDLPATAIESVAVAARGSRRLSRLVENVIDLERLESGRFAFHPSPHDLQALLLETVETLTPLIERGGIELVLQETHANVWCDGDRVLQALVNLVGNAIKFSTRGSPIYLETVQRGDEVEVTVRDEGRGIPRDQLDTVFDRFHQVDAVADQRSGGAGLGLTITRHIVEAQGGRIWVESEFGVGTAFRFTLPLILPDPHDPKAPVSPTSPRVDADPHTRGRTGPIELALPA